MELDSNDLFSAPAASISMFFGESRPNLQDLTDFTDHMNLFG